MPPLLIALIGLYVLLSAYATLVLAYSDRYELHQKWAQAAMIWALPIVGAILVWSLARDTRASRVTTDLACCRSFDDGDLRLENYSPGEGDVGGADGGGGSD
jgi:cyanate permease